MPSSASPPLTSPTSAPCGGLAVFGPVFFYDLLRTGRRRRYLVVRAVYALLLTTCLLCVYALWFLGRSEPFKEMLFGPPLPAEELASFAASFFYCFVVIQWLAVFLLTPAYCAGVLAEERERHTLEALLATDLRGSEIVLGLFASRLVNVALLVATGLPILCLLQFIGGVEPGLLLASFAFTGLSMVSLAALSVLHSIQARRPRDAIVRTYLTAVAYLAISGLGWLLLVPAWGLASFPSTDTWSSPVTLEDVVEWFNAGNLVAVVVQLVKGLLSGGTFDSLLPVYLRGYAWFHGLAALAACAWSVARLRAATLGQDQETCGSSVARPESSKGVFAPPRPSKTQGVPRWRSVSSGYTMLWKEVCVGARGRRRWRDWFFLGCNLALILWPALAIFAFFDRVLPSGPGDYLGALINIWVRFLGTVLACFMLLQVAVRAAESVSVERDRQTLDSLLATPVRNRSILFAKWLGSILSPRTYGLCLGLVWLIGVLTGSLHPAAIPCVILAWSVFAGFLAALGLWFSVASRSTRHATMLTLLAILAVLCMAFLAAEDMEGNVLPRLEAYCLFPPNTLGLLAFSPGDLRDFLPTLGEGRRLVFVAELLIWSLAVGVLFKLANVRFRVLTGRPDEAVEDVESRPQAAQAETAKQTTDVVYDVIVPRASLWLKRVARAALVLGPLCALVAWYGHLRLGAEQSLREALAEADQLDPGWRLEKLEARRAAIPDERNGALVIMAAKNRLASVWPPSNLREPRFTDVPPARQLDPGQIQTLQQELAREAAAVAKARRLKDFPEGRFPQTCDDEASILPYVLDTSDTHVIADLLHWDAVLRAQQMDIDGAGADCMAILNTARAIGDEAVVSSQDIRLAIQEQAVRTTQRVLGQGQLTEALLATLQRQFEEESEQPIMLRIWRAERATTDRILEGLQQGRTQDMGRLMFIRNTGPSLPSAEEAVLVLAGPLKRRRAEVLRFDTALVEIAKLPWAEQSAEAGRLAAGLSVSEPTALLLSMTNSRLSWTRIYVQSTQAALRAVAVAVAVERFRTAYGRWPENLAELAPAFLQGVPQDPFTGQPLRYRRRSDGVVVYSVGPDGQDNGGNLTKRNRRTLTDVGMQLWDVEQRRQPPGP